MSTCPGVTSSGGAAAGVALGSSHVRRRSEAPVANPGTRGSSCCTWRATTVSPRTWSSRCRISRQRERPTGDKIVAQFDPSGVGLFTQRYDFTRAPDGRGRPTRGLPCRASDGAESNTGNGEALTCVRQVGRGDIRGGRGRERHLLILSGHGSGTTEDFFLADENSRDSMTIVELRRGPEAARSIVNRRRSTFWGWTPAT